MDLASLTNQPTAIEIAGKVYHLAEFTLRQLGELQAWIKANVPHPFDVIAPHLSKFSADDRAVMLESARQEAASWPPQIGTGAAARILMTNKDAQVQTFLTALSSHHPDATRVDAEAIYRAVSKDATLASRVLSVIFGTEDEARNPADTSGTSPNA